MWLKLYYPAQFLAACLRFDNKKTVREDPVKKYIQEAARLSIPVEPPNVCKSLAKTDYVDGKIYMGLSSCRGVENAAELIIKVRPFANLKDFVNRIDLRRVNSGVLEVLAKVGAFSDFNPNRKQVFYQLKKFVRERQGKVKFLGSDRQQTFFPVEEDEKSIKAFDIEKLSDYEPRESRTDEMAYLGFSRSPIRFRPSGRYYGP